MGEDLPSQEPLLVNDETVQSMKDVLDAAAEKGIDLKALEDDPAWSGLEIETASGRIVLNRGQGFGAKLPVGEVVESEDPSLKAGWEIVIDGITSSGGSARIGVVGPGARVSFRRKVTKHYTLGEKSSDETLTLTAADIAKYTDKPSPNFVKTEKGMDLVFFDPTPRGTDFVNHLIAVRDQDGEKKSRYLF